MILKTPFLALFQLLTLISPSLSIESSSPEFQQSQTSSSPSSLPRLLIFSFDGFRSDALSPSLTPTLYSLAATGVTGTMRPSFPSKTFPNHHSIATGLYQPYHGVINNKFIDPAIPGSLEAGTSGEMFSVDNSSSFWWDMFNRNVPLYIANQVFEPERRFSGALQWPGSISTYTGGIFDEEDPGDQAEDYSDPRVQRIRHRVRHLLPFSRSLNWTAAIDHLIDRWIQSPYHPANLVMLYFHEPDSTSHEFGPFSLQVRQKLAKLDRMVAYFLDRLHEEALDTSTNLLFISDHGMAEITPARVLYLEKCTEKFGPDLRYRLIGVSPVYSIVPLSAPAAFLNSSNSSLTLAVQSALNNCSKVLFQGKYTVYQQAEIPPEYHYSGNRRILDLFLLAEDGYEVKYSRNDGKRIPRGNHGFNNSLPSMRPLFIGHGPAFKSGGYQHNQTFENVDLYPLALELLGIPGHFFPSNGSLERVAGLLRSGISKNDDDESEGGEEVLAKSAGVAVEEETEEELHFRLHTQREEMALTGKQVLLECFIFAAVLVTMIFCGFVVCLVKLAQRKLLVDFLAFKSSGKGDDKEIKNVDGKSPFERF